MKKVLYVTTLSRTINAFLVPHIEMLLDKGYKVDCACYIDQPVDKRLLKKGVKVYEIPFSRNPLGRGNLKAFFKLIEIQRINKYDIAHVHTPIAAMYGRLLKLRFKKLKTIYTAHGYHFLKGGSKLGWIIYYPIEKILARLTDVTININKEDYEITKNKLKPKKCYLMNGVGLELSKYKKLTSEEIKATKEEFGINEEDFVILMIAELNKNKNQMQLINAIELLNKKYTNIKVLLVGEGNNENELKQQINSKYLQKSIFMLRYRKDVNKLINISDIGILMSYREGLPRNLMELMACGRKVIASDIRGCRDIVCDDSVGKLVQVGDVKGTVKAIEDYYIELNKQFDISKELVKYDVRYIKEELWKVYSDLGLELIYENGISSYIATKQLDL